MSTLLLAAGGGGDVLACLAVHRALGLADSPLVATLAWERLIVDPVPGPRAPAGFTDLARLGGDSYEITGSTDTEPPGRSPLPRVVRESGARLFLLDASTGAIGMHRQVAELVAALDVTELLLVDVGGDVVATGDEPGLRSPLADALSLAACTHQSVRCRVLVAGPGLDGELTEQEVLARITELRGRTLLELEPEHFSEVLGLLAWHPSESTAILQAASMGVRGVVEVRSTPTAVRVTDSSSHVFSMGVEDVAAASVLLWSVETTDSLAAAERAVLDVTGQSELDYERRRAAAITHDEGPTRATRRAALVEASSRGSDYLSRRRLRELTGLESPPDPGTPHVLIATAGAAAPSTIR